ncbi:pyridoxal kinase-like [Amphibalanus amphitrite]|uniref:pyridoxal kinase-like n=1 Tax=Amphibalanus amphitrite TaxID=1232801 RepID=UPI001C90C67E|nr:pyridoxal kinase-like [Amphibalanus amphitrite]
MSLQRVFSLQSHVVSGYVGNKSATFPLQVHGFDVDAVNSVQFSNHTGYKCFKGQVLNDSELEELVSGLRLNDINKYSHLLTGYIGAPSFLLKVADVVKELKQVNPDLVYVCDPVMGDNGKMYVPAELLPLYKEHIIPLADILTPNQYEAELLTGQKISCEEDALRVMDQLHEAGARTVVLSSTDLGSEETLVGLASIKDNDTSRRIRINIPRLPASFTGTGDLFAACLLAWMHKTNGDLKTSCQKTVATLQDVLKRTLKHAQDLAGPDGKLGVRELELRLVQSLDDIRQPKSDVVVEDI